MTETEMEPAYKKWVNVPTALRPEQYERLRKLSEQEEIPMSILIRRAVNRMLDQGVL